MSVQSTTLTLFFLKKKDIKKLKNQASFFFLRGYSLRYEKQNQCTPHSIKRYLSFHENDTWLYLADNTIFYDYDLNLSFSVEKRRLT